MARSLTQRSVFVLVGVLLCSSCGVNRVGYERQTISGAEQPISRLQDFCDSYCGEWNAEGNCIIFQESAADTCASFYGKLTYASSGDDNLSKSREASDIIADFAERLCEDVPTESEYERFEFSGAAKADLARVLSYLASIGGEGFAEYTSGSESRAVIEEDLASAIRTNSDCRLAVLSTFLPRMEF